MDISLKDSVTETESKVCLDKEQLHAWLRGQVRVNGQVIEFFTASYLDRFVFSLFTAREVRSETQRWKPRRVPAESHYE